MTDERLQIQLEIWQRWLLVGAGAGGMLLATTLAEALNPMPRPYVPAWYGIWLVLEIALVTPGVALLVASDWRALPLAERVHTSFGYLLAAWIAFLAFYIQAARTGSGILVWLVAGSAIALVAGYVWARRRSGLSSQELFP